MAVILKQFLAFMLALGITLATGQSSWAQFSLPDGLGQQGAVGPPSSVVRYGNLEAIDVRSPLSDTTLFTIASPTVYDRDPDAIGDQQLVERRAAEIQAKLLLLLKRPMDPETLEFEVLTLRSVPVIAVEDAQYTRPLILASVTQPDADFNGIAAAELAEDWRQILETELRKGLRNLPANRRRASQIVNWLFVITIGGMVLKYAVFRRQKQLRRQKQTLNTEPEPSQESTAPPPTGIADSHFEHIAQKRAAFLRRLQQIFNLDRRLMVLDWLQWLLFWLLILAWYVGFTWVSVVSPYLLQNQFGFLETLVDLLTIWFFTGLAIRLSRRLIDRFTTDWEGPDLADFASLGDDHRRQLRASTIGGATKGLVTIAIALFGLLSALSQLGLPASVVAISSLVGLAVTFGSQNLVKDLVNGFLILAEDQYAIGDVIDLGAAAGLVENLNMRITQLRSGAGELVTIPNSNISQVKNLTRSWSRVNFSIDVAYHTDPEAALTVMKTVAQDLATDPEWQDKIMAEPTVLGIDSVSHHGMTITTWIQTMPAQQWAVGRELRLRVRRALAKHDIDIGTPRQTYTLDGAPKPKGLLESES